jgi:enamine deaminase RidA (YjgF/YER057c/UK114 family)
LSEKPSIVNPPSLAPPRGYSHGVKGNGEVLFVAGQIGWDVNGTMVAPDLVPQFAQALDNVLAVVAAAGGGAESIARLVLYVTDKEAYRAATKPIGEAYRRRMGRHFPAMTLVEVKALLEDDAMIEIEAVALV